VYERPLSPSRPLMDIFIIVVSIDIVDVRILS
jgi:hypothetical protein